MALSSQEINLLVFRYLQESGFRHSAFTFGHESLLARTSVVDTDLPYGSLVGLLQKGMQYAEIERQVNEAGVEGEHDHTTSIDKDATASDTGES
jgi:transducin (beta)-like 1